MENTIVVVRHTPLWVWGVLVYLVYAGIRASRPREQSAARLCLLPALFLLWGVSSLLQALSLPHVAAAGMAAALMAGGALGWRRGRFAGEYRVTTRRFTRAGSWWPLVLMLATFGAKFYLALRLARQPELAHDAAFCLSSGAAGGLAAGIFSGVSARLLWRRRQAPASETPS